MLWSLFLYFSLFILYFIFRQANVDYSYNNTMFSYILYMFLNSLFDTARYNLCLTEPSTFFLNSKLAGKRGRPFLYSRGRLRASGDLR